MQITPYLLKEAFLAKTHNLKHLPRHTNAVGIYHCSLLCSHSQISVRTDGRTDGRKDGRTEGRKDGRTEGQTKYSNPPAHAPRVNNDLTLLCTYTTENPISKASFKNLTSNNDQTSR